MNISALFIKRPIATSLLAAAVLLAGIVAYFMLPVAPLPRVDFPTINISASLPGADPETMASSVATPLERRFGRIAGVTEITSTSSLGATSITLQFDLDRDVDAAARDVQAAIAAAASELPPNLPFHPTYRKVNPSDAPTMTITLSSKTLRLADVFDAANNIIAQKISQVPGVGQVFVGGGQQPAVRVQVDPLALAGVGLSLEDVRAILAGATVDPPKGSLSGPFTSETIGADDQLFLAKNWKSVILAYRNGAPIRLADVANVVDDVENNRVAGWDNGTRCVVIIVRRQPGANIIETNERILKLIPSLVSSISPAVDVQIAADRTKTIRASVQDVERTLILSVLLVTLVVFAFLRTVRGTIIPSIAVPLSLLGTFGAMYLIGYSLDNLSLMALIVSTGFVVDDAIVVTENVTRFIEGGATPMEAALKGAKQIGFTIVSITVSLLAVFIPILMMGGIVGRLFREFAVTLSVAIAISAVVSLTLTPMMCAKLLKPHQVKQGRLYRWSEGIFDGALKLYEHMLRWVLNWKRLMLAIIVLTVVLTVTLFVLVPKGLFPQQDTGNIMGTVEAPQDISFRAMRELEVAVDKVITADPDIAHNVSFIGGGFGASAGNMGTVFIDLKPLPPRKSTADEIIARLRPKLGQIPGVKVFLQSVQDVRVGGRSARTQYQYTLQDVNLDELRTWAPRVMDRLTKLSELRDVGTDQQTSGLEFDVAIDRDTASRLGVTARAIDDTLYDAYGQRQVATSYAQLSQYRVVLEVKPAYSRAPDSINSLYVGTPGGQPAPLNSFAKFSETNIALSITHQGQFPSITLSFNLAPGKSLGQAIDAIDGAKHDIGLPPSIRASFQGTAQAFQASLASEPYLILAAILAVYIVLGILYESFIHPITILSTLPSAGIGALVALLLTHTEFSVIGLVGIILLIGIVKKNAILMIDFALEAEREQGLSSKDAIFQACLLRFRPIMMTTAAALLGAVPLAIGTGMGSEMRRPLGIVIIGGLLFSQMLTLFTTPVIYLALDKYTRKKGAYFKAHVA